MIYESLQNIWINSLYTKYSCYYFYLRSRRYMITLVRPSRRPPLPELHLNPISSILLHLTLDLHLNLRSDVGWLKRSEILCLPQKNEKNVVVQKSRIYFGPTKSIHKFISHVWKINTELLWPWYLKPMREENFGHVTVTWINLRITCIILVCAFWLVIVGHVVPPPSPQLRTTIL